MQGLARTGSDQSDGSSTRLEAVLRAEAYIRAHPDAPVSQLSRVVGLSERGLRDAFYSVRGMSPKRSTLAERLRGVRKALTDPQASVTVTGAAADFGFYELGRFAAVYRKAFGEAPSDTLRSTGRRSEATSHGEERTRRCLLEQET